MGFLSGLMGGTTTTNTSSTTSGMPAWFESYAQNLTNAGTNRFLNAAYPGALPAEQRVAPDNADINASRAGVRAMQGQSNPLIDQASNIAGSIGTSLDRPTFDTFMNPFTDSVVNRIGELGSRNLEQMLRNVNANFISGGNFGSGEHSEFTNRAVRDANESTLAAQNQALQQGYGQALGAYGDAQNRGLQTSSQLGALAKLKQDTSLRDAAALEEVGKDERQRAQMGMDVTNANFLEGRDWERNMANAAAGIGSGINVPTTTNTVNTTTQNQNAGLGQLIGLGTSIASLFKEGGKVRRGALRRAEGGKVPGYYVPTIRDPDTGKKLYIDEAYVERARGGRILPRQAPKHQAFAKGGGALRRAA